MVTCIIIEDDKLACEILKNLLKKNFPDNIFILGTAETLQEGIELIRKKNPELIFLDIDLPDDKGFNIYHYFTNPVFDVIFTTSSPEYALQAIKHMAIDYLLKPINLIDLNASLVRFKKKKKYNKVEPYGERTK